LRFVIDEQAVSTCLEKVQAVSTWPVPVNVKELRSFLGLVGYYRKNVNHFGVISRPLTELLKKDSIFVWTSEQDIAFQTLKIALVQASVLV
jgi:hypothetical protein